MRIGLSLNKQNYSKDFCRRMLKSGIDYAEVSLCWGYDIGETEDFADQVLKGGLKIWSLHIPFGPVPDWDPSNWVEAERKAAVSRILPYFGLAQRTGACRLILHTSFEPIPDEDRGRRGEAFGRSLEELGRKSRETDVLVCVENLPRTCMGNTSDEILALIRSYPDIFLCCDLNHMMQETTEAFLKKCIDRVRTVHISDYDGIDEKHWLPGEGIIKWERVSDLLKNYDGVYMMELKAHKDGRAYTPEEAADAIKSVIAK
jgi:sugar phosphate isomerase/epimerase